MRNEVSGINPGNLSSSPLPHQLLSEWSIRWSVPMCSSPPAYWDQVMQRHILIAFHFFNASRWSLSGYLDNSTGYCMSWEMNSIVIPCSHRRLDLVWLWKKKLVLHLNMDPKSFSSFITLHQHRNRTISAPSGLTLQCVLTLVTLLLFVGPLHTKKQIPMNAQIVMILSF